MKRTRRILLAGLIGLMLAPSLLAAADTLTYQAKLRDAAGLEVEGPVTVEFRMYATAGGGAALWTETQNVTAVGGVVNVELGRLNPLPAGVISRPELYLSMAVAGDPEMTPRVSLAGTWKAVSAHRARGKAVQSGTANFSVSNASAASVNITFPTPFAGPPVVLVSSPRDQVGAAGFTPTAVTNVSATGCAVHFAALYGEAATGGSAFDWIAIGK